MKVNSPLAGVAAIVAAEQGGAWHASADGPDHPRAAPNMHFRNPALRDGDLVCRIHGDLLWLVAPVWTGARGGLFARDANLFVLCRRRSACQHSRTLNDPERKVHR